MQSAKTFTALLGIAWVIGCTRSAPIEEIRSDLSGVVEAADVIAAPGDWPWWRGPHGNSKSDVTNPPTTWTATQNVAWSAEVPGRGHSSPIVVGDRVFLTTADEDAQQQLLLAYDRESGGELWSMTVHEEGFMRRHDKNSHASATPACDGARVYCAFINSDALWVTATDLDGEIIWQYEAGPFVSEHGYGSSPVLYKSLVIVSGDNAGSSFIAALDRETGEIVWRTAREKSGSHGSYGTPIIADVCGKPQLLLTGHGTLTSYDPASGERLWSCDGPCEVSASSVACSEDTVFASGGYPEKVILAVRADGNGDVTRSHIRWRVTRGVAYVPSPLFHEGHLYVVDDEGIATCLDSDGTKVWQRRVGGPCSASPTLAGGYLFITDEAGATHVLKAAPEYELVAENGLPGSGFASPVICGDQIYLRSGNRLYCIAESKAVAAP